WTACAADELVPWRQVGFKFRSAGAPRSGRICQKWGFRKCGYCPRSRLFKPVIPKKVVLPRTAVYAAISQLFQHNVHAASYGTPASKELTGWLISKDLSMGLEVTYERKVEFQEDCGFAAGDWAAERNAHGRNQFCVPLRRSSSERGDAETSVKKSVRKCKCDS